MPKTNTQNKYLKRNLKRCRIIPAESLEEFQKSFMTSTKCVPFGLTVRPIDCVSTEISALTDLAGKLGF